jgi:exopolyphosphatase/guanosine-5'-triphosphate,3'-diphosphate pyrophosphatase
MNILKTIETPICAIDIGSNSIHYIIAIISENGEMKILSRDKESIRLGKNMKKGFIEKSTLDDAIKTLKKFKEDADNYNALIKAVATSAIREAINKDEIISEIKLNTGIEVNLISGKEEGELISKGINFAFPFPNRKILTIDIGGGSTEIILSENSKVLFVESLKLGAVRTSNEFFENYVTNSQNIKLAEDHIKKVMANSIDKILNIAYDDVVGTSGTIQALSRIVLSMKGITPEKFLNNITIKSSEFYDVFQIIENFSSPLERATISGIDNSRSDIISAGGLILKVFLNEFSVPNVRISSYSLREGIIIDTFEKMNLMN